MLKRLGVVVAFALLGACSTTTQEAPAAAPEVRVYAIDCGTAVFPDVGMFADDHSMDRVARTLAVPCYLIRHPHGDLIWDTGFPDALAAQPMNAMGGTMSRHTTLRATCSNWA